MEEEGEAQQPNSPFWANHGGGPRRTISSASAASNSSSSSSSSSSSLLKQWMFISILLVIFVLSYSFRGRTFRLSLVRTSWDYLNFALLVFAIVCGVLGPNDNGGEDHKPVESVPPPASPPRWFGYGETTVKENSTMVMRRNSSSYPDLRQQQWVSADEWRFADDIGIYRKERKSSDRNRSFRDPDEGKNVRDSDFKTIHVDTVRLKKSPPPPPPPPPPPAPPVRTRTVGMVRQSEGKDERRKEKVQSSTPSQPQPQQPSIPPPPPPIPATMKSPDGKEKRTQRRRKDIGAAISMFYQKNKRNSSKGKRSYDDFLLTSTTPPIPIPPPPPPPPPPVRSNPSVLYQLFHSKKEWSNNKSVHSVPPPPPPPLPPPARTITPIPSGSEMGRSKIRETAMSNQVPVIPPPPVEEMVFPAVAEEGGDRGSSLYCPSPDVNSKADMFIARLHEGWRLEKLNSIKQKEKRKQEEEEGEEERERTHKKHLH